LAKLSDIEEYLSTDYEENAVLPLFEANHSAIMARFVTKNEEIHRE